jgi:membrane glycosyltransferase
MQVAHHYFENGIAHFTRRINKSISIGCANGEVAPFVGHNAFLRWSALQDAAFIDSADGKKKIWSESNVSEDFDMALRLQLKRYSIRWATYSKGGFKEGVSLTVDDELNRWQKYSYGKHFLVSTVLMLSVGRMQRAYFQSARSLVEDGTDCQAAPHFRVV